MGRLAEYEANRVEPVGRQGVVGGGRRPEHDDTSAWVVFVCGSQNDKSGSMCHALQLKLFVDDGKAGVRCARR